MSETDALTPQVAAWEAHNYEFINLENFGQKSQAEGGGDHFVDHRTFAYENWYNFGKSKSFWHSFRPKTLSRVQRRFPAIRFAIRAAYWKVMPVKWEDWRLCGVAYDPVWGG